MGEGRQEARTKHGLRLGFISGATGQRYDAFMFPEEQTAVWQMLSGEAKVRAVRPGRRAVLPWGELLWKCSGRGKAWFQQCS